MIQDQDGNLLHDGDWVAFNVKEMARANIVMIVANDIELANGQKKSSFINVVMQIPCLPNTKIVPGVSKIYGPHKDEPPISGS